MNESYRLGEQSIIAHLQRLANGASTTELDVAALPPELRAIGEQLQKTLAILQQERELLEHGAYIDSLTNLGNRGGLDRHVDQLWRKGTPFTCAYIDIDRLKHCNDKFGHAEGNRYILSICRALTETMEHDELLFRIGGDEFVLISPTTDEAELDMVVNGTWHFHCMQYRVMNTAGKYALCDCTGYRLDGTDTEPNMYVGIVTNRSLADTTDSVTGLGDIHALVNAIGEMRRVARNTGLVAIKIDDIAKVNARFGFDAGDRVLAESAACLMDCSRGKGRLFRSTGPMFVALFDELDPEETDAVADEIERFLGSPVLLGSFEYQPPLRVATLHLDAVDRQPVSILNELNALIKEAPQAPGTKLD